MLLYWIKSIITFFFIDYILISNCFPSNEVVVNELEISKQLSTIRSDPKFSLAISLIDLLLKKEDEKTNKKANKFGGYESSKKNCRRSPRISPHVGSNSLKYPSNGDYSNNEECTWEIFAESNSILELHISILSIEVTESCFYDFLEIYDGLITKEKKPLAKICGFHIDPLKSIYRTSSNIATIRFGSDEAITNGGFQIDYKQIVVIEEDILGNNTKSSRPQCSNETQVLRDENGSINFSRSAIERLICRWMILANPNHLIQIKVLSMKMGLPIVCVDASLQIYDGHDEDSNKKLATLCGKSLPSQPFVFNTTTYSTLIVLDLGKFTRNIVFNLEYNVFTKREMLIDNNLTCSRKTQILRDQAGEIYSPGFNSNAYANSSKCSWQIIGDTNQAIRIMFDYLDIEYNIDCFYDSLSMYDGPDRTGKLLGKYCGRVMPKDIITTSNIAYVVFISDSSNSIGGFHLIFSSVLKKGEECGISSITPNIYSKIVGGLEATPNSWPWQVSIKYQNYSWLHWCGGSLFSKQWILTAAHCLYKLGNEHNYSIVLGEHNRLVSENVEVELTPEKFFIHPEYDAKSSDNDIALVKLPFALDYNEQIKPVCLPSEDIEANTMCVSTGWGDTEDGGLSTVLRQVQLPTIERSKCNERTWYNNGVTRNMICAGYPEGRKDSCQGDSGGPLVCLSDGKWIVQGVTSWGIKCGFAKKPGIYTRVTRYLSWIQDIIVE